MINNKAEYQQAIVRIEDERKRLAEHYQSWKDQGFTSKQIVNLREPL